MHGNTTVNKKQIKKTPQISDGFKTIATCYVERIKDKFEGKQRTRDYNKFLSKLEKTKYKVQK